MSDAGEFPGMNRPMSSCWAAAVPAPWLPSRPGMRAPKSSSSKKAKAAATPSSRLWRLSARPTMTRRASISKRFLLAWFPRRSSTFTSIGLRRTSNISNSWAAKLRAVSPARRFLKCRARKPCCAFASRENIPKSWAGHRYGISSTTISRGERFPSTAMRLRASSFAREIR